MRDKIKLYIAAPFELQSVGQELRTMLEATEVFIITSRWLDEDPSNNTIENTLPKHGREMAGRDLEDLRNADGLLAINPETFMRKGTGGRHVELGYILGLADSGADCARPIWILGVRSNVFHDLADVQLVDTNPVKILASIKSYFSLSN